MGFPDGREGWPRRVRRLVNGSSELSFVYDRDAGRRLKVKLRFRDRDVLLPIAEAEFSFHVSSFVNHDADKMRFRIGFEEHLSKRILRLAFARTFARGTTKHRVP